MVRILRIFAYLTFTVILCRLMVGSVSLEVAFMVAFGSGFAAALCEASIEGANRESNSAHTRGG